MVQSMLSFILDKHYHSFWLMADIHLLLVHVYTCILYMYIHVYHSFIHLHSSIFVNIRCGVISISLTCAYLLVGIFLLVCTFCEDMRPSQGIQSLFTPSYLNNMHFYLLLFVNYRMYAWAYSNVCIFKMSIRCIYIMQVRPWLNGVVPQRIP